MKKILILFFICHSINGQIVGDCSYTQSHYDWLKTNRYFESSGKYISTGIYDGAEWFGDIQWVRIGASELLSDYRNSLPDRGRNVSMPQNQNSLTGNTQIIYLPNQGNTVSPACGDCIENLFNGAVEARILYGESTLENIAGVTQSRNLHAIDLAQAVKTEILFYANSPWWDASNNNRFDIVTQRIDQDPYFIMATFVEKQLRAYGRVIKILRDTGNITTGEELTIQTYFERFADFYSNRVLNVHNAFLGSGWRTGTYNLALDQGYTTPTNTFAYFDSSGTGYLSCHVTPASIHNNRWWDMIALIGAVGTYYNDTIYESLAFDCFQLWVKIGMWSDGTHQEWHRQSSGIVYGNAIGQNVVRYGFEHAVAIHEGFITGNAGKILDYTTSEGSTTLFGGWATTNTDGGQKGVKLFLENHAKYYQGDFGHVPRRYMGGTPVPTDAYHGTSTPALANLWYKDNFLEAAHRYDTSENFATYNDNFGAGAWQQESYGWPWGKSNATGLHAILIAEQDVFSNSPPAPPPTTPVATKSTPFINFFVN